MVETSSEYIEVLLDTFRAFDSFCKDKGLQYFAAYGTAIGVVRHQGLIPWDYDIYVYMLREDYERFKSYRGNINEKYDIMDERDENYWFSCAKFYNINTSIWEHDYFPVVFGVYIDVFPLDEAIPSEFLQLKKETIDKYLKYQHTFMRKNLKSFFKNIFSKNLGLALQNLENLLYYRWNKKKCSTNYREVENRVKDAKGSHIASYWGPYGSELFEKEWFSKAIEMPFEGMTIPMAVGYDNYLRKIYGDYMELPPEEKRITHHNHLYENLKEGLTLGEIKERMKNKKS